MSGINMTLGRYLKIKREAAGLTQGEVGKALGYTSAHQYVSNWERGLSSPPAAKLYDLVKLYKIDAEELIDIMLSEQEKILRKVLKKKMS